jgi:hypothetical protein
MLRIALIGSSALLGATAFRDHNHDTWLTGHLVLCGTIAGWGLHEIYVSFGGK